MKKVLEDVIRSTGILTEDEIVHGLNQFEQVSLKKNEFLIEAGQVCDWIAFVSSGVLRNFYVSDKGDEITYCITFPNKFVNAYTSFLTQEETIETIQAVTDTELLLITKSQYFKLNDSSKNWLKFSKFFTEQSYIYMENRLVTFLMKSAESRYEDLLKNHSDYLQQVPLKYLASYLGITQRHLSRLRKNISF